MINKSGEKKSNFTTEQLFLSLFNSESFKLKYICISAVKSKLEATSNTGT
jgi:hypothetical protein